MQRYFRRYERLFQRCLGVPNDDVFVRWTQTNELGGGRMAQTFRALNVDPSHSAECDGERPPGSQVQSRCSTGRPSTCKRHSGQSRLSGTPDAKKCTRTLVSIARLGDEERFSFGPAQHELASGHDRRSSCKAMQGQIRLPPFRFRNLRIRRALISCCPFSTDNRPRTPMQVRSDIGKPLWRAASQRWQRLARALLNGHRGPRLVFKGE